MTVLIVGSVATRLHFKEARSSRLDVDIICREEDFIPFVHRFAGQDIVRSEVFSDGKKIMAQNARGLVVEAEIAHPGSTVEAILHWAEQDKGSLVVEPGILAASVDLLYMLKMSHRYKKNSPHFYKTMEDILFLRDRGATIVKKIKPLYKQRMLDTYDYAHPNLKQSKKDFFTDTVPYKYDHDSIHRAVAEGDIPAYAMVKDAQDEVHMKKENFKAAPILVQLRCTLEESYVLSLERAIIPFNITDPVAQKQAFNTALMKVCTSITSGWFRQFSWENYHIVQSMYDRSYIDRFNAALENGAILPFERN